MPGRLGPRFALEAVFLIALAIAMGLADLTPTAIIVVMAVAWLLVAIVEWLASRGGAAPPSWNDPVYAASALEPEAAPEPETQLVPPPPPPAAVEEPHETPSPTAPDGDDPEPAPTGGCRRFGLRRRG